MPRYAKAIADIIYKGFYWVFGSFFADVLPRQTEKFWNYLGILLPTCVCVFMLFHLLVSSGCTTSVIYVRSSDQRSFVVSIFWVLLPSSFISISESILFHLQRRKLQPTAYWRENDMICLESVEKMIYIDIGNKSARSKPRSYEKILKVMRLL